MGYSSSCRLSYSPQQYRSHTSFPHPETLHVHTQLQIVSLRSLPAHLSLRYDHKNTDNGHLQEIKLCILPLMSHTGMELHLQDNREHHYSQEALENPVLLVSRCSHLHPVFPWVQPVLGGPAEPTLNHKGQNTVRATTTIIQTDGWTYRNAVISRKARHAGHSLWSKKQIAN